MAYLSLYRQWRPQTFEDIVGQEHIVRTLKNAILNSRVVHAYMFAGPRGTGKTSTAKVFAKSLNCIEGPTVKPCGVCVSCLAVKEGNALDVIEIDAASNRGIDEIRDLRDKVRFSPAQGRYKVYIIDEVHMLTMEAFNALLKTLEEPPSHAIFILATTEANRVPSTILSRCQRFDFNRLNVSQLSEHLRKVSDDIGIAYDKDALVLISRRAEGSARDALGLLEQVSASGDKITARMIADMLGSTDFEKLSQIASSIASSKPGVLYPLVSDALSSGTDPRQLLGELGEYFMDLLLAAECPDRKDLLHSGEEQFEELAGAATRFRKDRLQGIIRSIGIGMAEIGKAPNPRLTLELFLARLIQDAPHANAAENVPPETISVQPVELAHSISARLPAAKQREEAAAPKADVAKKQEIPLVAKDDTSGQSKQQSSPEKKAGTPPFWGKVLDELRRKNVRVEAFARQARPYFDGKDFYLEYSSDWFFHHQKMKEDANESLMKEIVESVAGAGVGYRCVLLKEGEGFSSDEEAAKTPVKAKKVVDTSVKEENLKEQPTTESAEKQGPDEEKVRKSLEKAKALFSEVEIKILED